MLPAAHEPGSKPQASWVGLSRISDRLLARACLTLVAQGKSSYPRVEPLWAEIAQGEPDEQAREHFLALSALYDCWRSTLEDQARLAAALQACRLLDPRYLGSPAMPHHRPARVERKLKPAAAAQAPRCELDAGSRAKRRCSVCRAMVHPSAWPEHAEHCFHKCAQ